MGSFRQLLLVAFMLIAALLGGTALRAVVILDRLMAKSSEAAGQALALNGAAQALTTRTAGMERAARQSLILNDSVLRKQFEEETRGAHAALAEIDVGDLPKPEVLQWHAQADTIQKLFQGPPETALERERSIAAEFRELVALNNRITAQTQALIEQRNKALDEQLEASRVRLTRQVLLTIALAVLLAVGLGIWLARPFKHLERAIVGLGENRLGEPINIQGPSDVRGVSQHLEWLRLRLTELDADKARFLRHVSHELKTPLAALHEGVALLQEGVPGELNRSQRDVTRILHQNTLTLQGQIEALLRFNAAAFEARQLQRRRTDLLALIEQQVEAQHLQCQAMQLEVVVEGEPVSLHGRSRETGHRHCQPAVQCHSFFAPWRHHPRAVIIAARLCAHRCARPGSRRRRNRPRTRVRAVLPRRAPATGCGAGHGHRAVDRQGIRPGSRRAGRAAVRQPGRPFQDRTA